MGLELITINNLLMMTNIIQSIGKRRLQTKDLKRRETREVSVGTGRWRLRVAGEAVFLGCWTKQLQEL